GLAFPPRTSWLLAPAAAAAYVLPAVTGARAGAGAVSSVTVAIPVCILVAETIARTMRQVGAVAALATEQKQEYQHQAVVLREAEERFRLAFDNAPIGMALVAPDGRFLRVNRSLCDIVGYPAEELVTKTFQDITHPDDLEADLGFVRQMLAAELRGFSMEKRYFHADGNVVWVNLSVSLVRDEADSPLYFISQIEDITGRKAGEEALRLSHELLDRSQALARVGSWEWDVTAGPGKGARWSREMYRIHGVDPERFVISKEAVEALIHPDDLEMWITKLTDTVVAGRDLEGFAYRAVWPDGTVRWVWTEASFDPAQPTMLVGFAQDITERKQAEAALLAGEERLRRILDTAGDAFVAIDQEGRITAWNRQAEATFGWDPDDVVGRPLDEVLIPPDLRAAHRQGLATFLATGHGPALGQRLELTALHRDGRVLPVELVTWALQEDGQWHFNAFLRDISQRKAMEAELERLAMVDDLTGLRNRRGFLAVAEPLAHVAQRTQRDMALLYIDLDNMKAINDRHGHAAGDQALIETAELLRSTFRDSDIVARLGGDEFCVLLPKNGIEAKACIDRLEERLCARGAHTFPPISLSMGVAKYHWDEPCPLETLIERADAAMYQAKTEKRAPSPS
ncbi:MAG: PAS domain S-box protein, partial [Acidimicrobiia bacterium]